MTGVSVVDLIKASRRLTFCSSLSRASRRLTRSAWQERTASNKVLVVISIPDLFLSCFSFLFPCSQNRWKEKKKKPKNEEEKRKSFYACFSWFLQENNQLRKTSQQKRKKTKNFFSSSFSSFLSFLFFLASRNQKSREGKWRINPRRNVLTVQRWSWNQEFNHTSKVSTKNRIIWALHILVMNARFSLEIPVISKSMRSRNIGFNHP